MTRYWFAGSTEEFTPPQLVEQARAAEAAGLDAIRRLWDGETVTVDTPWFRLKQAKLFTRAARARPAGSRRSCPSSTPTTSPVKRRCSGSPTSR